MDRNTLLSNLITSYKSFSTSDARSTVEKVLKYSGDSDDISQRADVKRELVVFRLLNGDAIIEIEDIKPLELDQTIEVLIYVEQGDSHSIKEARYDRLLDLSDQVIDWLTASEASAINSQIYNLSLQRTGFTREENGFLFTTLTFTSIIKLQ